MTSGKQTFSDAVLDLQAYLDQVGRAAFDGDAATYLEMTERPYQIITAARTRSIDTEEDMIGHLNRFRAGVLAQRLTDMFFILRSINMLSPALITGIYETHLMRNAERIVPPYASLITLRRRDGIWRAVSTIQTIGHADWNSRIQPNHTGNSQDEARPL